jgi:lysophospholipase L1-like esterase
MRFILALCRCSSLGKGYIFMKTILCYGDSNTWGAVPLTSLDNIGRYGPDVRWGSVLRTSLGPDYWVVEEGLNGRTTVWPDPIEGEYKNGKAYLLACLESHQPIDLVVVMLGTNDLKHKFGLNAWEIAAGAGALVDIIQQSTFGVNAAAPRVLLICPPPLARLTLLTDMFAGGSEKSRELATHYAQVAAVHRCDFLDAGEVVVSSEIDGIHFDAPEQQKLGRAVAKKIKAILG